MAKTSYESQLIVAARGLQRLATKRRALVKRLKALDAEIRHERKMLNALRHGSEASRPDVAPSRLHAGVTGYDYSAAKRIEVKS